MAIHLVNPMGQDVLVKENVETEESGTFNLSTKHVQDGIYIIRIKQGNGALCNKKVIIAH